MFPQLIVWREIVPISIFFMTQQHMHNAYLERIAYIISLVQKINRIQLMNKHIFDSINNIVAIQRHEYTIILFNN